MPSPSSFIILLTDRPTGNGGVARCTTTHNPIVFGTGQMMQASLGRKERKKVEDVVSKYPDMPLLFLLPPFFLSRVSVLCSGGRRSFRSSRVCLSWL